MKEAIIRLFERRMTRIAFVIYCAFITVHYVSTMIYYYGMDVWKVPIPALLTLCTDMSTYGYYFIQMFPVIAVVPGAFLFMADWKSREIVYLQARSGRKKYVWNTVAACFWGTIIFYAIPMLVQLFMFCIMIPSGARHNLMLSEPYNREYLSLTERYLFPDLYNYNVTLYMVAMILLFSILTAILACFALLLSMIIRYYYTILVFLPVYLLLMGGVWLKEIVKLPFETNYYFYLNFLESIDERIYPLIGFVLILCILNLLMTLFVIRRDEVI
ncbi:hypothetical protein [Agathobacter ruminis]|uniref:Uncharacterized protein n=1 Tax=Agathobacter ruminis TaxID=1712665 RepID=A0A2G3DZV9_9FIRM|nr:hypothetical protein [Agathobacter ruminis]MDC7300687.1 hypothetical protein [Agathobacter ruminis]PHU36413.1 hypothetical protein CSX02_12595 [Agathobacter ruminis]